MATVDNSTAVVTSTESGTGWSIDVTACNLDPDLTLKDFTVRFDGAIQNNVDFTKTSVTVLTYNGVALGSPTEVVITRNTPNDRVFCVTYGDRFQSATYEAEFNRVHKLINENEIGGADNVKVSADDTTPGTLDTKLAEGNDITFTVLNPGGNEQLRIDAALAVTGEPYVDINSVGTLPVAAGTDSIVIGNASFTDATDFPVNNSIVIGNGSIIDPTPGTGADSSDSIAIGTNASVTDGLTSIAIGDNTSVTGNTGIALGSGVAITANDCIAIGDGVVASATDAIAIGDSTVCNGEDSIAMGEGTDIQSDFCVGIGDGVSIPVSSDESVAIGNSVVCNGTRSVAIGDICNVVANSAVAIGRNTDVIQGGGVSIGLDAQCNGVSSIAMGAGAQINTNSDRGIAIGNDSRINSSLDAIAIGHDAITNSLGSICIGNGATIAATSPRTIAIGDNADIGVGVNDACQIGTGTNSTNNSLQFLGVPIYNSFAIQTRANAGAPATAVADGSIYVDNTNDEFYFRSGGAWITPSGTKLTNQDITSGVDITVTPGVSNDRLFITPTANINLILLTAGATNETFFTFVNLDPGSFSIDIKIDLVGNPTILTLSGGLNNVNTGYSGTDYRFWG